MRCKHCNKEIVHFSDILWHDKTAPIFPQYCSSFDTGREHADLLHEPQKEIIMVKVTILYGEGNMQFWCTTSREAREYAAKLSKDLQRTIKVDDPLAKDIVIFWKGEERKSDE